MTINHIYQPNGISCGPTCIKMALTYLVQGRVSTFTPTIEEISEMCETDNIVGTPPDRMEKGLKALGVSYVEYSHTPRPYITLVQILNSGNVPILRTITKGVPHWIIVTKITDGQFFINDPWQGEIVYTEKELDSIWKVRDYQFFELIKRPHAN